MELLTVKQVASELHVSLSTIWNWTREGRVPTVRLGKRVLFRREDLEALVERNLRPAKDERGER
jgi:excisionase family DNA binding protein